MILLPVGIEGDYLKLINGLPHWSSYEPSGLATVKIDSLYDITTVLMFKKYVL